MSVHIAWRWAIFMLGVSQSNEGNETRRRLIVVWRSLKDISAPSIFRGEGEARPLIFFGGLPTIF